MPAILRYAAVTLTPLILLWLGASLWGGFAVAALVWLTLIAAAMDRLLDPPASAERDAAPWSDGLSILLAVGHLALLPVVLGVLAGPDLSFLHKVALFAATASFFGQVSHPNAHELIHRRSRVSFALGALVYVTMGFGHHVSAHRMVHHRFVGTARDPNTPRLGESFWAYLPRAWAGSFRAGLAAETARLSRRGLPPGHWHNPYWAWLGGGLGVLALAAFVAGPLAALTLAGLCVLSGAQILMSDYVQHYGLRRLDLPGGRTEPVGAHHSWNAPRGFTSYLMLNAPSHSEHHLHPDRSFDRLESGADGPTLPHSLPVMAVLATVPPLWRRVMDRRVARAMAAAEARRASCAPTEAA